ncbi:spore gernimation protein GerPD [Paenibacillus sp. TRM 82003]|nr:spore gernimation protein GerPD [Paenibacillus sp. TRM 82003]
MRMTVINRDLSVGTIRVIGVAGSSVLLVGDVETIRCSSVSDTPPESVIVEPIRPLPPEVSPTV